MTNTTKSTQDGQGDAEKRWQAEFVRASASLRASQVVEMFLDEMDETAEDRRRIEADSGLRELCRKGDIASIWAKLRGIPRHRAVMDLAARYDIVTEATRGRVLLHLGERHPDLLSAIDSGGLVLVEGVDRHQDEYYWEGEPFATDLKGVRRDYLYRLVLHSKKGQSIDTDDLTSEVNPDPKRTRDNLATWKHRLRASGALPASLAARLPEAVH